MIVKRSKQIITSRFGRRKGFRLPHLGIDLRTRLTENPTKPLPIVAPEGMQILHTTYQKKWGYTIVARGMVSGKKLKFIHIQPADTIIKEAIIHKDKFIGFPMVTEYMESKKYGEHLHFEVWSNGIPCNPEIYLKDMDIPFYFKKGV